MATNNMMFKPFDVRKETIDSYLSQFALHCLVHDIADAKKTALLLTSVDSLQQDFIPKLVSDATYL